MTDTPAEDLDEIEADVDDGSDEVGEIVEQIRGDDDGRLRLVVRYDGDDHDVVYVREDIEAGFTPDELEERVETLVMKGLGDPSQEGALYDFGDLDATIRWYEAVVVAHFPIGEWSGLVFTLERETDSLDGLVERYF